EVGADAGGVEPEDLAAEGNRVVEEALLAVARRGLLPGLAGGVIVSLALLQVADAVVQRGIGATVLLLGLVDGLPVEVDGSAPLVPLLVLTRGDFELVKRHGRPG